MTLQLSGRPIVRPSLGGMEDAIIQRKRVKRAFLKLGKVSLKTSAAQVPEKVISVRQGEEEWERCAPLQIEYLDAGLQVIEMAASGNVIMDNGEKCKKVEKDPAIHDICQELDQMFFHVVSKPTRRLRQCMDKPAISSRKRQWAHEMLMKVLAYPMLTFFKVADILGYALMRNIDETRAHTRLRAGLLHVLMYIGDCYRYSLEYKKSKDAAQLMRIFAPGDAEAHMRVAINLAMLSEDVQELPPFFHYCAFLANRNVTVAHVEAVVVSRFVQSVRISNRRRRVNTFAAHKNFAGLLIDTLWSILAEDFDSACEKTKRQEFWKCLKQYLSEGAPQKDVLLMIGCVIFVHYRTSPQGNEEGKTLLQSDLTETIVCKMISSLSLQVCSCLQELNQTIRGRKKNRRRAMQKKRRLDGAAVPGIPPEIIGYEVLKSIADIDTCVPYLGALAFLTHYWSKARMAPSPNSDFDGMADALENLRRVVEELVKVEDITCATPHTGLIGSKIIADTTAVLPAMTEDILFCNFCPCQQHNMFRNVLIQEVPFASILHEDGRGLIKTALRNLGDSTYESVVTAPVRRHLEAFGQKCIKESNSCYAMDKESSAALVMLTLRKFRINRLVLGLEKVGGGKLSRMITARQKGGIREEGSEESCEGEQQPPAGQPVDEQPEDDSFRQDLTSRELGSRLRKRRRLMGTSTPADVGYGILESNSNGSSRAREERRTHSGSQRNQERQHPPANHNQMATLRNEAGLQPALKHRSSRRATTYMGMLSQGSFQLTFTPPMSNCEQKNSRAQKRQPDQSAELSRILREVLYPTDTHIPSPPRNLTGPVFWRSCPSDDYVQIVPVNRIGRSRSSQ